MLATLGSTIPTGAGWLHEIKWDGMRVLATVHDGALRLTSRTGRDVTSSFPELAALGDVMGRWMDGLPDVSRDGVRGSDGSRDGKVVLDGEIVCLRHGVPSFAALGSRMHVRTPSADLLAAMPVTYVLFDAVALGDGGPGGGAVGDGALGSGALVRDAPLADRRALLETLTPGPTWHLSPVFDDGDALFAATREQRLEGTVAKRADSRYQPGARSEAWLKFPHRVRESYVIGGWRPETGSRRLGAVLLGTPGPDGLRFRGRMGSGLAGAAGAALLPLLTPADEPPFAEPLPRADAHGTQWVTPSVVVDVTSLGSGDRLRHPTFQGVRSDLTPADLTRTDLSPADAADGSPRASPALPSRAPSSARPSNPDKVLYPASGTTKAQVADYYVAVADRILAHLRDRPVTRIRWPHGVDGPHFFEKNLPRGVDVESVTLPAPGSRAGRDVITYPLLRSADDLVTMANLAAIELHTPQWRVADGMARNPDRLVVDLDPGPPAGLRECARVALLARAHLGALGLTCTPVTSGSKGMQLYAPLDGSRTSEQVRAIARALAELLTAEHPDLVVASMRKDLRQGKVLLDWSQNTAAKTTITPWSLRGRSRPWVACPRTWDEVGAGAAGERFEQVLLTDVVTRLDLQAYSLLIGP